MVPKIISLHFWLVQSFPNRSKNRNNTLQMFKKIVFIMCHFLLTLNSDVLASYTSSKRSTIGKIPPKIRYNPKIRSKLSEYVGCVVETYMFWGGMSRQVFHLRAKTCMLTSCFTCCQSSVDHLLPAKTDIYPYLPI
jgi:hypothetical protein